MIFLSFFGSGYSPFAPGTAGTLAAMPFLYLIAWSGVPVLFLAPLILFLIIGSGFVVEMYQKQFDLKDPGFIVIDEVIGVLIAFCFYPSQNLIDLAALFFLFRVFDILKPWPANYFDKQVAHGLGVILDDVVAGIYAGLIWLLIRTFIL